MKKLIAVLISLVLFAVPACAQTVGAEAAERVISQTTEQLDDGYYMTVTLTEDIPLVSTYATENKSCTKTYTLYNNSHEELWSYSIRAYFSVNYGVSATCTAVYEFYSITDTQWSPKSTNCYYSGNVAYGEATFKKTVLFITTNTVDCEVTITCDVYGNMV